MRLLGNPAEPLTKLVLRLLYDEAIPTDSHDARLLLAGNLRSG